MWCCTQFLLFTTMEPYGDCFRHWIVEKQWNSGGHRLLYALYSHLATRPEMGKAEDMKELYTHKCVCVLSTNLVSTDCQ